MSCGTYKQQKNTSLIRQMFFAENLEKVCIQTIESGYMTKDLALLVGSDQPWLTTTQFLNKIDENFKIVMSN